MSRSSVREGRKIKQYRNPSDTFEEAVELTRKFHGREAREVIDLIEVDKYDKNLAILGDLLELNVVKGKGSSYVPIRFAPMYKGEYTKDSVRNGCSIKVCTSADGRQISFKDGKQDLDLKKLFDGGLYQGEASFNKDYCIVGPLYSIVYFTDKHHLQGPKQQEHGVAYEHVWGEQNTEDSEVPWLVYDVRNKRLILAGGSYEVREEGIWN